jgi:hypothetical protein
MALIIGSARHDENGRYSGGRDGDQDKTEVSTQTYYVHSKGWYVIRPKSIEIANKIASAMLEACNNDNIGYDQNDRNLIAKVKKYGSLAKISIKCDTDCSDLVRACVYQASGKDSGDFYTATEPSVLAKTGLFETAKKVTTATVLYNGDILVTQSKGHTAIVVSGRPRSEEDSHKTGWVQSGSDWYYRLESGVNAHGFNEIKNADGKTRKYYFDSKGKMLTNWQEINSKWYYFQPSGDLAGAMYVSDSNGVQTIWVK